MFLKIYSLKCKSSFYLDNYISLYYTKDEPFYQEKMFLHGL